MERVSGRRLGANAGAVMPVRQPGVVRGRWEGTRGVGGEGGNGRAPARPFKGSGWRATVLGDFFGDDQAFSGRGVQAQGSSNVG